MERDKVVIGLGFGDEGKGKVVSHLCSKNKNSLVVRFSGGHQAGHHVVLADGKDHVHSNTGSGTMLGADTYWSKYCTIEPIGMMKEFKLLAEKGYRDFQLFIDERCPVVTPLDIRANIEAEACNRHGTCGVGFGQTIQREADHYSLLAGDMLNRSVFRIKVDMIAKRYGYLTAMDSFWEAVKWMLDCEQVKIEEKLWFPKGHEQVVFEGSQGLLLDKDIGFFPHVTRSNTGTKNVFTSGYDLFFVTRAYSTRHGNGPFPNEGVDFEIRKNPYEANVDYVPQGRFKTGILDLDLLKYGLKENELSATTAASVSLVITCLDLMDEWKFVLDGSIIQCEGRRDFIGRIANELGITRVFMSNTPYPEDMEQF